MAVNIRKGSRKLRSALLMDSPVLLMVCLALAAALLLSAALAYRLYRYTREEKTLQRQRDALETRLRLTMENQEEERKRFSGALHEEIGMRLQQLKLQTGRLAERMMQHAPEQGAELRRIAADLEQSALDIRSLSDKLLPRILADKGLEAALSDLCTQIFKHSAVQVRFSGDSARGRYGQQVEIATYRMARELLSNVLRHAAARELSVALRQDGNTLVLTVQDDGRGFDPMRKLRHSGGLEIIQSHLHTLGGKAYWESATGRGTTVSLHIPLN